LLLGVGSGNCIAAERKRSELEPLDLLLVLRQSPVVTRPLSNHRPSCSILIQKSYDVIAHRMRPPGTALLQLTQYDERGWRATFCTTGMEHSPTSVTGTAWERTPVAYDAVNRVGRQLVPADKERRSAILAWFAILR
jgi:hypothetical protein